VTKLLVPRRPSVGNPRAPTPPLTFGPCTLFAVGWPHHVCVMCSRALLPCSDAEANLPVQISQRGRLEVHAANQTKRAGAWREAALVVGPCRAVRRLAS